MGRKMQTALLFVKLAAVAIGVVALIVGGTALQAWLFWSMKP